jgi:hypothetical protein
MIVQMELVDIAILQAVYGDRVYRGDRLSDHEVAFALLMENTRELAQRLAAEAIGEPEPAPK